MFGIIKKSAVMVYVIHYISQNIMGFEVVFFNILLFAGFDVPY